MSYPVTLSRFQQQVIRAYKAGLAKAQDKVKFYEGLLKSSVAEGQKERIKIYVSIHQGEVRMFKELLASAQKKLGK